MFRQCYVDFSSSDVVSESTHDRDDSTLDRSREEMQEHEEELVWWEGINGRDWDAVYYRRLKQWSSVRLSATTLGDDILVINA